jgi:hypothetical protein
MQNYDQAQFNIVIRRVIDFLCQKAVLERRPQTENNPTQLGGVAFWFKVTADKNGNILAPSELAFNAPPKVWDFTKIIYDLEEREKVMFINMGANIEGYDPFR